MPDMSHSLFSAGVLVLWAQKWGICKIRLVRKGQVKCFYLSAQAFNLSTTILIVCQIISLKSQYRVAAFGTDLRVA